MITGIKTKFFSDVKIPVRAGMQFNTKNYKLKIVGHDHFRLYFDNDIKDCQVGSVKLKRVFKKSLM